MNKTITIGRSPSSTIRISEDYDIVSNDHAEIVQQGGELTFVDHSSNGTLINGQKIKGRSVAVYPGDRIVLAGVCELSWETINAYIAIPVGRPTVARNIRAGGDVDAGRRHSGMEMPQHYRPASIDREVRMTEYMDRDRLPAREPVADYPREHPHQRKAMASSLQIDREVDRWNWGAFYFGWLWGIFNKVYIALLQLIAAILSFGLAMIGLGVIAPFFTLANLGLSIWLGVKGSRMAWDNGAYRNLEHFRSVRHGWNVAAAVAFGVTVFAIIISLLLFIDIISRVL